MPGFKDAQKISQIKWWKVYSSQPNWSINNLKWGIHGGKPYEHIILGPWTRLLWSGIQKQLPKYLGSTIKAHSGVNNLLSSWVVAANLYFPANVHPEFRQLLLGFLQLKVNDKITDIHAVELEYALPGPLSPEVLLGELDGGRGTGQTSPDVAFEVKTATGKGLILTECKYTEHSFYRCSARRSNARGNKPGNPNPNKCLNPAKSCDYRAIPCHQHVWGRKYLNHFQLSTTGKITLNSCPAATAGYQLMRQQALANGIYNSGQYEFVVSSVSFDARNTDLIQCLKSTGIPDFQTGWSSIYDHGADFMTWHHQDWVDFVRAHFKDPLAFDWLNYIHDRYAY